MNLYTQLHQQIKALPGVKDVTLYRICAFIGLVQQHQRHDRESPAANIANPMAPPRHCRALISSPLCRYPSLLGRDILDSDSLNAPKVAVVNENVRSTLLSAMKTRWVVTSISDASGNETIRFRNRWRHQRCRAHQCARPTAAESVPVRMLSPRSAQHNVFRSASRRVDPTSLVIRNARRRYAKPIPNLPLMNLKTQIEQTGERSTQERLFAQALEFLRPRGAATRVHRALRHDVLCRNPQNPRNRHPHGARRKPCTTFYPWSSAKGLRLTAIGVAIGIVAGVGLTRWIASFMYGVSATDPARLPRVSDSADPCCLARLLHTGAARDARRSADSSAVRMNRLPSAQGGEG